MPNLACEAQTLAASMSGDAVTAAAVWLLGAHVILHDYKCACVPILLPSRFTSALLGLTVLTTMSRHF